MARLVPVLAHATGLVAAAALALSACGGGSNADGRDAGTPDAPRLGDASTPPDGGEVLSFVEFAISGCRPDPAGLAAGGFAGGDAGAVDAGADAGPEPIPPCRGNAPLALGFTAIAPAAIDTFIWRFGDGSEDTTASPVHVYQEPGSYDVSLTVGGPSGTAMAGRPGAIEVEPAKLGQPCARDSQCGARECVCDEATACAPNLAGGLCSEPCAQSCGEGVCADLQPAPVSAPEDWQRALCLPACAVDADCPAGRQCVELLDADGAWTAACFADGALGAVGDSCADANGGLDHGACAGGLCVGQGARGFCSSVCTPGSCPGSSACAAFADPTLGSLCVERCEQPTDCAGDPRLACEMPGGVGGKAFTVDEPAAPGGYCAPKRCQAAADCGAGGACVSGFCAAAP